MPSFSPCRTVLSSAVVSRRHQFHTTAHVLARSSRRVRLLLEREGVARQLRSLREGDAKDMNYEITNTDLKEGEHEVELDDTSSLGHNLWRVQRQYVYYMRLIEHEMPRLVPFRKPFVPAISSNPLVVRSFFYAGEKHPASIKRSLVVPVALLPLKNDVAIHKFKLLAGVRWSEEPPKNSGIGTDEGTGAHGYIHISCEDFPKPAMNLKWASDVLDRLITEANDTKDTFQDVPLDKRHLNMKARKAKQGDHVRGRVRPRPSIKDFPQAWLPNTVSST